MKITYMGKPLKQKRDRKGKFTSFISQVKSGTRKAFMLIAFAGAMYGVYFLGQHNTPKEIFYAKVEAEVNDILAEKVSQLENEVLDTLQKCESMGFGEDDALITFDPDPRQPKKNIPSLGQYQFKVKTIVDYTKMLYGKEISNKEAVDIALSTEKSRELARDIIFLDKGKGIGNWYNCMKKHNLDTKVGIIKELIK